MKKTTKLSLGILLGVLAAVFGSAGKANATNVITLTGYWQDDSGNFIEVERNGPDAIAIMRSERGRNNWTRGAMDLSGSGILLVKKRRTRTVGQVRGELVRGFGNTRIRWSTGRIWKKTTPSKYNASHQPAHANPHQVVAPIVVPPAHSHSHFDGRWQTSDKTIVQVTQEGSSLSVRVVSGQRTGHPGHSWTSAHGRVSQSQLSLDCYHGSSLDQRLNGRFYPGTGNEARITWSNGQTWRRQPDNLRAITQPVVSVCRLPVDVIGSAIPARATSTWQSEHGGYFHRGGDGYWNEYSAEGQSRHRYRESGRTNISVTLFDGRRGIRVRLQKDQCWMQSPGRSDWRQISPGRWLQRPPTETRPSGSRHPGHRHGQSGHSPTPRVHGEPAGNGGGLGRVLQGLFGGR